MRRFAEGPYRSYVDTGDVTRTMTEKITDSERSRRAFIRGTVAAGAGAAGIASVGTASAQDIVADTLRAVQRGSGLVTVQLQVTDAVDIGSVEVTVADNEVVKDVANNNRIAIPIQVSGNAVGANVAVAILGTAGNTLDQATTTVSEQTTRQA